MNHQELLLAEQRALCVVDMLNSIDDETWGSIMGASCEEHNERGVMMADLLLQLRRIADGTDS